MNNQFLQALKELGQFLGRKLDGLAAQYQTENTALREAVRDSQKLVQLDMTASTIEKLQKTSDLNINKIATTLEKSDRSIEKIAAALDKVSYEESNRLQKLTSTIAALKEAVEKDSTDTALLHDIAEQIRLLVQLEQETKGGKDDAASTAFTEEVRQSVKALLTAIKESKPKEAKPVDMSPVTRSLGELKAALSDLSSTVRASDNKSTLNELLAAIKALKLTVPSTVKLDEQQFRALRSSGSSTTVVSGGSEQLSARNITVANVALSTANTEGSYTFPSNTVGFELRTRDTDVPLLVAYTTGKLPISGDGLAYFTVPAYFIEKTVGLDWSGKTIFFQTGSASQTVEILVYHA